jgi:hypothetical protein
MDAGKSIFNRASLRSLGPALGAVAPAKPSRTLAKLVAGQEKRKNALRSPSKFRRGSILDNALSSPVKEKPEKEADRPEIFTLSSMC